jgi:thioredoxin reductase (NADPH)
MHHQHMEMLTVYGTHWCPDCHRSRAFLDEHRIPYAWVDIDADAEAGRFLEKTQRGGRTVPMIVFADGSCLLEPSDAELAARLGIPAPAGRGGRPTA